MNTELIKKESVPPETAEYLKAEISSSQIES